MGAQVAFLTSDLVQQEIAQILECVAATSLDVERKHNIDKKSERSRLMTVSRASRNSIIERYHSFVRDPTSAMQSDPTRELTTPHATAPQVQGREGSESARHRQDAKGGVWDAERE